MKLYHYFSSVTFVVQSADQNVGRVDGPLEKHSGRYNDGCISTASSTREKPNQFITTVN